MTKSISHRTIACLFALIAAAIYGNAITAQEPVTSDNAGTLIKQVYDLSQQAGSEKQYDEIIELCERLAAAKIDQKKIDYAKKLGAWGYNRRGEVYAERASGLADKGDTEGATAQDKLALADFNRSIEFDATKWKAFHNRGVSHALAGEYEQALADFSRSVELEPEYSNTWFNRGEIHFETGDFAKAIADYNQALRLKPNDIGAISRRGRALARINQHADAIRDYTQVIRLAPQDAETYVDRAEAYAATNQRQQAANDFRQAIRLNAELGRAYRGAAWLMATSPVAEFRNSELALQAAQRAVQLDGREDFATLDALAAALADSGKYVDAVTEAKAALEVADDSEREAAQARLKLYQQGQPYRQSE